MRSGCHKHCAEQCRIVCEMLREVCHEQRRCADDKWCGKARPGEVPTICRMRELNCGGIPRLVVKRQAPSVRPDKARFLAVSGGVVLPAVERRVVAEVCRSDSVLVPVAADAYSIIGWACGNSVVVARPVCDKYAVHEHGVIVRFPAEVIDGAIGVLK